jgi:hypothetical protein
VRSLENEVNGRFPEFDHKVQKKSICDLNEIKLMWSSSPGIMSQNDCIHFVLEIIAGD